MNSSIAHEESLTSTRSIVKISLVAALYMAVTLILSVISFGPIQLRLSEMFNYLALFHKRYVVAVFLGVVIANFMSPMWFIDVPIGGLATLAVLLVARAVTKNIKNVKAKFIVTAFIATLSMFSVAVQFYLIFDLPFWWSYLTVAIGELLSMTIGGFIMYYTSKKIDLTQ